MPHAIGQVVGGLDILAGSQPELFVPFHVSDQDRTLVLDRVRKHGILRRHRGDRPLRIDNEQRFSQLTDDQVRQLQLHTFKSLVVCLVGFFHLVVHVDLNAPLQLRFNLIDGQRRVRGLSAQSRKIHWNGVLAELAKQRRLTEHPVRVVAELKVQLFCPGSVG